MKYILFLWLIFLTDRVRCDGDILQNIKPPDYRKKAMYDFLHRTPMKISEMRRVKSALSDLKQRAKVHIDAVAPPMMMSEASKIGDMRASDPDRVEVMDDVRNINDPLLDYMYQGDILLDMNQTDSMMKAEMEEEIEEGVNGTDVDGARKKRQAQTGPFFPSNQWSTNVPIPYYFDSSISPEARRIIRLGLEFWHNHSCLSFEENGAGAPRVKFFQGGGCYSQVGKAFRSSEQGISIGRGCAQFGIVTHEVGHTLGFFHGQSRADRDQFITVLFRNLSPQLATQFVKQSPATNDNLGITYDYGSVMHYSDTDPRSGKVTMMAHDKIYQHTMGNNVEPSFHDVFEMNLYYKCLNTCPKKLCYWGGFPSPRNCSVCICPSGFGGHDCGQRASGQFGAPEDCGATLTATAEYQELKATVKSGAGGNILADRHARCTWHIKAPVGKRIEIVVEDVGGACAAGCFYGATEIKVKDISSTGARLCCKSDIESLGTLTSESDLAIVIIYSQFRRQRLRMKYRYYPSPSTIGQNAVALPAQACKDNAQNCDRAVHLCTNILYQNLIRKECAATCNTCGPTNAQNDVLLPPGPMASASSEADSGEQRTSSCVDNPK
ncbi:CBN-NAS-31 protein [Aphelenchoides avenae]|nr:CBN-NAS-31 protein [Aphelenchus avenae]